MPKPSIEQKRARFALERIEWVLHDQEMRKKRQNFLIELRHLPAQLHWGGLGQAAASFADPKNEPRRKIYEWLQDWLRKSRIYSVAGGEQPSLIHAITGGGGNDDLQNRYVAATREARALAVWLKKFAEAFLPEPAKGEDHGASAAETAG
jgi:hypothetical protein